MSVAHFAERHGGRSLQICGPTWVPTWAPTWVRLAKPRANLARTWREPGVNLA